MAGKIVAVAATLRPHTRQGDADQVKNIPGESRQAIGSFHCPDNARMPLNGHSGFSLLLPGMHQGWTHMRRIMSMVLSYERWVEIPDLSKIE